MKMNYIGVLLLCVQLLWGVQAKSDCPKECTCVQAAFGGSVAHCKTLNLKQNFSNSVQHLNVTNSLPEDVFYLESKFFQKVQLEDIQSIKIINSSLSFIDENAFVGMDNLNFVDLSDNLLVRIHPNTFRSNNNLQQLSLSGNILELPLSPTKPNHLLESLTLKNLDLSRCQLRQITNETLSELPNLVTLNLESNYIHFLSSQVFEKLEFLEEINLSNNLITDIDPELFVDVEDLTTLKLSHNSISKFDDVDISSLVELDLSYNSFKTLESTTLEGTQDITNLNFSNNNIAKVNEDTFTDLNRLRYVDLSHNNIVGPLSQFLFETNEDLETVSVAHNPELGVFEGFKGDFKSLYRLDISYCGLKEIKEETFESLQHVSTLDLSGNELTELGPNTFVKLTRLNNLDLSDNQLTKLDEDLFRGNMDLRKLSIKGNRIHHLPARLFQPVIHLSSLDVSDCHLTYLWNKEETVYMKNNNILSQISHINLSNNKFKTLHKHNFDSMSNLKSLDISKNSFQCDENFMLFVEWLVQEKKTPARYVGKSSADMVHEHAELHWSDMLAKVCSGNTDIITKENKIRPVPNTVTSKSFDRELINEVDDSMFKKADLEKDIYVNNLPEIEYTSNFGLIPETAIKTDSSNEKDYPWVWSMFLVLVCGLSILLALFNLTALLLYRTGSKYKSAGYRSTFVTPLSSHLKIRRDAGSLYHKLYEECSVPNTVPPMKNSDSDFVKSVKKNTIILSGATKGEDMV